MTFVIGLLTVVMVLDCLLLILLVLIQLPKKEAGAGIAFGGSATDALFGAGTGNVLTKATKWATITFFVLLLLLGYAQTQQRRKAATGLQRMLEQQGQLPAQPGQAPATNALTTPLITATNLSPAVPGPSTSAPPPQP